MTDRPPSPETPRPKDALRDAATVILMRDDGQSPRVLMGQRGKGAAFMPSKFVFPGGALDPDDHHIPAARPLQDTCLNRLQRRANPALAAPLANAAIRELWEETGLALACSDGPRPSATTPDWQSFFDAGHRPDAGALEFVFRAITPPGRPRRFDARFFLANADCLACDPDDLSRAGTELSYLSWLTLTDARKLDLPFITGVVLAEVEARLAEPERQARPVPFFHHADGKSFIDPL